MIGLLHLCMHFYWPFFFDMLYTVKRFTRVTLWIITIAEFLSCGCIAKKNLCEPPDIVALGKPKCFPEKPLHTYCQYPCEADDTEGDYLIVCSEGLWIRPVPKCITDANCAFPHGLAHGTVSCMEAICVFTCDDGYDMEGQSIVICDNGTWHLDMPICVKSKCEKPINVENGKVACEQSEQNTTLLCSFTCNDTYELETGSKNNASCQNGSWSPEPLPKCVLKGLKCEEPKQPENGNVTCKNAEQNTTLLCSFTCNESYELENGSKSTASCQNGSWPSEPLPKCVKTCKTNVTLENGSVLGGDRKKDEGKGRPTALPVVIYLIEDKQKIGEQTTIEKPAYQGKCKKPIMPKHGVVLCADDGTNCKFYCESDYKLDGKENITCRYGRWTSDSPTCKKNCKSPVKPDHGNVTCSYLEGKLSCKFYCDSEYNLDGKENIECRDGLWTDKAPTCNKTCKTKVKLKNRTFVCEDGKKDEWKDNVLYLLDGVQKFDNDQLRPQTTIEAPANQGKCKIPDKPDHGDVYCAYYKGKEYCRFYCDSDYEIYGKENVVCHDRQWTDKAPTCKKKCRTPDKPVNGNVKCGDNGVCKFFCDEGYSLKGMEESYCKDSKFGAPICVEECVKPTIENAVLDCKFDDNSKKSMHCIIMCKIPYELDKNWNKIMIICSNGKWLPPNLPQCVKEKYCPSLKAPDDGEIDGNCRTAKLGQKCLFKCRKGYHLHGKAELFCAENHRWSYQPPNCFKSKHKRGVPHGKRIDKKKASSTANGWRARSYLVHL